MRVAVDPWKCQSHLQCLAAAPTLFEYDEDHSYAVAIGGDVPPELRDAARAAVVSCPEGAISIVD